MIGDYQVSGANAAALFTLKLHRGEGMLLLAMNWKKGTPQRDFVGFAIEYKEPNGTKFYPVNNRLSFPGPSGKANPNQLSTRLSPIQKFRWIHFPRNAELEGDFLYRVTPVFMNDQDQLSYGDAQEAAIQLQRETYPGELNVAFTRGFVASQAFVDHYEAKGPISELLPAKANQGLDFVPTHPSTKEALTWMGFEAWSAILEVLDGAIADTKAQVCVVAYDLNEPDVVSRLEKLGKRLRIIIDNSKDHGKPGSAETQAATRLEVSAGQGNVLRQHMMSLQHNKTIVVDGPKGQKVVCGSTNLSWRGIFVQNNNAIVLQGQTPVKLFQAAFEEYWAGPAKAFGTKKPAQMNSLAFADINARVAFSPHGPSNALLDSIASDISDQTSSCLFFSLAFLYETPGAILNAIKKVLANDKIFACGISDKRVGGLDVTTPDGNSTPVYAAALRKNAPEPFRSEPTGGGGTRMHHKFVVIDFDKPTARVYTGSYNFSAPADTKNGENLLLIRDRRIAVAFTVEALRIFDHYQFRVAQQNAKEAKDTLQLMKPPRKSGETAWWEEDYTDARKVRDRELFA